MNSVERVMVIDGGGRGQAIGKKLAEEGLEVVMSPGNPGNEDFAHTTSVSPTAIASQLQVAKHYNVDLTVVGADKPLELGIVDYFQDAGRAIFGPTRQQAKLEWDRSYGKQMAKQLGVPIGPYAAFDNKTEALKWAEDQPWPLFVKDNELAQGKGAKNCHNIEEFEAAISGLRRFVVEDFVEGQEASLLSFCDGEVQLSPPFLIRDHKQLSEGDTGPMTGGMGTVAPLHNYAGTAVQELSETFASPVVRELGFKGMLFSGLKGYQGYVKNLEWNVRPGDPEMQTLLALMKSDLLPLLIACTEGNLADVQPPEWIDDKAAICLVLAAEGYPENPQTGAVIRGIETARQLEGVDILQAGTAKKGRDIVTAAGRVLNALAIANDLESARKKAYAAAEIITFGNEPPLTRPDIGQTALDNRA